MPVALAVLALALGAWTFDTKLSLSGDNAEYIVLARSLAQGRGLTYISSPAPQPATKFPFAFPLMLAPLAWLDPDGWVGMKVLVLVLFAAGMPALYALLRPRLGWTTAATTVVLCMLWGNSTASGPPLLLDFAHQIMSEIPYLTFSVLALWLVERGLQQPGVRRNRALQLGFASAMWAYYLRTVGLVLLAAVFVYLLARRDWRRAIVWLAAAGVCWLPWSVRNWLVGGGATYLRQLVMVDPYLPEKGLLDLPGLLDRIRSNLGLYVTGFVPYALCPWQIEDHSWWGPVALAQYALVAYTAFASLRHRRDGLLGIYTVLYLGTVILWPWPGDRFLVPIVPLLGYYAVRMAADATAWAAARGHGTAARAALAGFCVLWLGASGDDFAALRRFSRGPYPADLAGWTQFQRAGEWLRAHAAPDAVIMCRKEFWLHVVCGRRCLCYPFAEPAAVMAAMDRNQVTHVVVESLGYPQTARYLAPAITANAERFTLVWANEEPPTYVFAYHRAPVAPRPPAP